MKSVSDYLKSKSDQPVRFICYADPPGVARASITNCSGPVVTLPHSWSSKARDEVLGAQIYQDESSKKGIKGSRILDSSWDDKGGLIVLAEMPFSEVVTIGSKYASYQMVSLCACLEHSVKEIPNQPIYCDDVIANGFIVQPTGGCNPMGYAYFPKAPKFNRRVNRYMAYNSRGYRHEQFLERPRINDDFMDLHFPKWKINGANSLLEKLTENTKVDGDDLVFHGESDHMMKTIVENVNRNSPNSYCRSVLDLAKGLRGSKADMFWEQFGLHLRDMKRREVKVFMDGSVSYGRRIYPVASSRSSRQLISNR